MRMLQKDVAAHCTPVKAVGMRLMCHPVVMVIF